MTTYDYSPAHLCYECGDGTPSVGFSTVDEGKPLCGPCILAEQRSLAEMCAYCIDHAVDPEDELATCGSGECRSWALIDARETAMYG